jgi:hypothetical protein
MQNLGSSVQFKNDKRVILVVVRTSVESVEFPYFCIIIFMVFIRSKYFLVS